MTQTWIQDWTYDRYGNRTGFTQNIGGVQNNTTPAIDANTNRFVANQGYSFDKNGNVVTDAEGRQFTFNGDNKQTQVKDANNNVVGTYYYDGDGKRIKKVTNLETTTFVYSGGKLVEEYSGSTLQTSYLYAGSQLLATETATDTNYTATDQLGSPRVVTNASGQVVSRRDFLPFGEEIFADGVIRTTTNKYSLTGQDAVRQRFTGYQRDLETGLDFAEARYYYNSQGRFTAVDPLLASGKSADPQTFNRYVYALNNPTALHDPTGLQAGKADPPERCNCPVYVDSTGNHFSTVQSHAYPTQFNGTAYATSGGKNYQVTGNSIVEIGVSPPSEEDRAAERMAAIMAQARKIVANGIRTAIHYEVNPFGIDVSDPGTQMALIEATGGLAGPMVGEEEGAAALETAIAGEDVEEGYNLAFGLSGNLDDFAAATNSQTYVQLLGTDVFVPEYAENLAVGANEVNFNLRGFSWGRYANWQEAGRPEMLDNATNYEMDMILSDPDFLEKTNFGIYPPQ